MRIEENIIYIDSTLKNTLNKVASDYYFEKLKPNAKNSMSTNDSIRIMLKNEFQADYIRPKKETALVDFGYIQFPSEKYLTLFLFYISQ